MTDKAYVRYLKTPSTFKKQTCIKRILILKCKSIEGQRTTG